VFEKGALQDQTLEEFVDLRIQEMMSVGDSTLVQPKKKITLNSNTGFTYESDGFGSATHLIIQKNKDTKTVLIIDYFAHDVQDRGYQKEVDAILSSIVLNN